MQVTLPSTSLVITRQYIRNKNPFDQEILEGEVPMSQEQQDYYKRIIGDGQARVTLSRELSEQDYGNGGKVFLSISLACDQSAPMLQYGIGLASQLADYWVEEHRKAMRARCVELGLLKPPVPMSSY